VALESAAASSWIRTEQGDYNKALGKTPNEEGFRRRESASEIATMLRWPLHGGFNRQSTIINRQWVLADS
jgi:hypothetical protein